MPILRIQYRKDEEMKFISHLDMAKLMERGLRRMYVPLKFSQGFHPHPKIAFAAPLSVGVSSEYELVDIDMEDGYNFENFESDFKKAFPNGITLIRFKCMEKSKALMRLIRESESKIKLEATVEIDEAKVREAIADILVTEVIEIQKKKKSRGKKVKEYKTVNIRPFLKELHLINVENKCMTLFMRMVTSSEGNLKPESILAEITKRTELDFSTEPVRIHRKMLYGGENLKELYEVI